MVNRIQVRPTSNVIKAKLELKKGEFFWVYVQQNQVCQELNFFKEKGVDPVAWNIIEYQTLWPVDEKPENDIGY